MNYFKKFSARKVLSIALVITLCATVITIQKGEKAEGKTKTSVYDEIQKANITEQELMEISEDALSDGEKTAEKINQYTDKVDYEKAVNYALTEYYGNEDYEELKDFEDTIDDRSDDIVKAYKAAAKEREKGVLNGYEPGEVLLSFDKDCTEEEINAMVEAEYGECKEIIKCFNDEYIAVVSISLGQTVDMAVDAYSEYSITEIAAANDLAEPVESASDYINDPIAKYQYYLDSINVKGAWDYISQVQHEKVLVGVIDTGIQINHPDLVNVISPESADVTLSSTPVLLSQCTNTYTTNHGTRVAGTIAAEANNSRQVAGVASCYENDVVEILGVQASTYYESYKAYRFSYANAIKAINYCAEKGAKVINYSAGSLTSNSLYEDVLADIKSEGIIFVCSAGNDSSSSSFYPSDSANTLSVMATDKYNNLASFTNYGMKKDICAPGVGIYTTSTGSSIGNPDGTSFSSPIAAAVVAMMCSLNMNLDLQDVRTILADTSTDIGIGDKCRNGLINAEAAVKMADGYTEEDSVLENISKNKPVTVSSSYSTFNFPASNMVDDNNVSRWLSTNEAGQSVTIDLEDEYLVNNIQVLYDGGHTTGMQVLISSDGETWREVVNNESALIYSSDVNVGMARARYVKINYIDNTSYMIIREIRVWGKKASKATVTPPIATLEVIGVSVSSPADNTVGVVWGQDSARIEKGYKYNVYINGEKYLNEVECNYYTIENISAGEVEVKVTSVLSGVESAGVTMKVTVNGANAVETTVKETEVTTASEQITTVYDVTTTEKATEIETTTVPASELLEVIGAVVSSPADNTVGIVWGQDSARIESGCRYNVYIDGVKYLSEVVCNYYAIENISAGNVTVKVTSVLGGVESAGVTLSVTVNGATLTPIETTTEAVTTTAPETTTVAEVTTVAETTTEEPTTVEETTSNVISETNIALNKTVYSSSNENDSVDAPKAFDGDMSTRWSSAWADNQWVYVDLGDNYNVARVKVFWEAAFATQFKIQVSTDAANWQDVATLGDTYCKDYDVEFTPVNARYVRMLGITRGTEYGFSIYEMEVYATEKAVQTDNVLLSQGKTAVASSSESDELVAKNVIDGDLNTRWSSAWTDQEWIYIDLWENKYVSYVEFDWEAAYATTYQVLISDNGTNWQIVNNITNGQGGKERVDIGQNARYVKMQGANRSTTYGYSLYEMSVYGY